MIFVRTSFVKVNEQNEHRGQFVQLFFWRISFAKMQFLVVYFIIIKANTLSFNSIYLLAVKLTYDPVCPSVCIMSEREFHFHALIGALINCYLFYLSVCPIFFLSIYYLSIYLFLYIYLPFYLSMYVCTYVCIYIFISFLFIYMYIY